MNPKTPGTDAPTTLAQDLNEVKQAMQDGTTEQLLVGGLGDSLDQEQPGPGGEPNKDGEDGKPAPKTMPDDGSPYQEPEKPAPADGGDKDGDGAGDEDPRDVELRTLQEQLTESTRRVQELTEQTREYANKEVRIKQANTVKEINAKALADFAKVDPEDPERGTKELQILLDAQAAVAEALADIRASDVARRVVQEQSATAQRETDNTTFIKTRLRAAGFDKLSAEDLDAAVEAFEFELGRPKGAYYAVPEEQRKTMTNDQIADLIVPVVVRRWGLSAERVAALHAERDAARRAGRPIG